MFGGKCPFGHKPSDPFKAKREAGPVARYEFQGEQIPMILRHAEVRQDRLRHLITYRLEGALALAVPPVEDRQHASII